MFFQPPLKAADKYGKRNCYNKIQKGHNIIGLEKPEG